MVINYQYVNKVVIDYWCTAIVDLDLCHVVYFHFLEIYLLMLVTMLYCSLLIFWGCYPHALGLSSFDLIIHTHNDIIISFLLG